MISPGRVAGIIIREKGNELKPPEVRYCCSFALGWWLLGWPRTNWTDYICHLAWEYLSITQQDGKCCRATFVCHNLTADEQQKMEGRKPGREDILTDLHCEHEIKYLLLLPAAPSMGLIQQPCAEDWVHIDSYALNTDQQDCTWKTHKHTQKTNKSVWIV